MAHFDAESAECQICGGELFVASDEYLCLEQCVTCLHSRLLGWFSNEALLVPGATEALGTNSWARHVAA
jgi:hypothetical protein